MSDFLLQENGDKIMTEDNKNLVKTPTEKLTAYKLWYVNRDDEGYIVEATVRVYQGNMIDFDVYDADGNFIETKNIFNYETRLNNAQMPHMKQDFVADFNGGYCVRYTSADFGSIQSDAQLHSFIKTEINKDTTRLVVANQRI